MNAFFRRIRYELINEKRFVRYLKYALGEIILVVIGILIALQINNWNNHRLLKNEAIKTYETIHDRLAEDREALITTKGFNTYFSSSFEYASGILLADDRSSIDTLAYLCMGLSQFSDFRRSGNIYETLVNSGDIKLLDDEILLAQLQKLEMTYNHINQLEEIHWAVIINELSPEIRGVINYATLEVVKPEQLYSVEIQNILIESIFLTQAKDSVYSTALQEIEGILGSLERHIGYSNEPPQTP